MTYSSDLSAVSLAVGGSQVTLAVSFPGSATLSLDGGHLIFGGSVSERNSLKGKNNTGDIRGRKLVWTGTHGSTEQPMKRHQRTVWLQSREQRSRKWACYDESGHWDVQLVKDWWETDRKLQQLRWTQLRSMLWWRVKARVDRGSFTCTVSVMYLNSPVAPRSTTPRADRCVCTPPGCESRGRRWTHTWSPPRSPECRCTCPVGWGAAHGNASLKTSRGQNGQRIRGKL